MTVNDRLYDELLVPVSEAFYDSCKELAGLRPDSDWIRYEVQRAFLQGRLDALEQDGERIARVLDVPAPLWEGMRELAGVTL